MNPTGTSVDRLLAAGGSRGDADSGGDLPTVDAETPYGVLRVHAVDAFVTPYLLQDRLWEPGETANIADRIRAESTFIDVGAHVGYYTLLAARLVGSNGLVVAFEPEPKNFELLIANVGLNRLENVVCFSFAVSDLTAPAKLYLAGDNTGDHRLADDGNRPSIEVRTIKLDELDGLVPPVGFVKLDTQGGEEAAIRGMETLLAASPEVELSLEFWAHAIRRNGQSPPDVLAYYRSLGFAVALQDAELPGARPTDDAEIIRLCERKDGLAHVNLMLTRDYPRVGTSKGSLSLSA
jgi:FkbM family methyltransferase